jgi:hypothetical protein
MTIMPNGTRYASVTFCTEAQATAMRADGTFQVIYTGNVLDTLEYAKTYFDRSEDIRRDTVEIYVNLLESIISEETPIMVVTRK